MLEEQIWMSLIPGNHDLVLTVVAPLCFRTQNLVPSSVCQIEDLGFSKDGFVLRMEGNLAKGDICSMKTKELFVYKLVILFCNDLGPAVGKLVLQWVCKQIG